MILDRPHENMRRPETDPDYRALALNEAITRARRAILGDTSMKACREVRITGAVNKTELFDQDLEDRHLEAELAADLAEELRSTHLTQRNAKPGTPFDAAKRDTDLYPENFESVPTIARPKDVSA